MRSLASRLGMCQDFYGHAGKEALQLLAQDWFGVERAFGRSCGVALQIVIFHCCIDEPIPLLRHDHSNVGIKLLAFEIADPASTDRGFTQRGMPGEVDTKQTS